MFGSRWIRIDEALSARLRRHADAKGYSSVNEFVTHVLERELSLTEDGQGAAQDDEIKKRLKGLGYLS